MKELKEFCIPFSSLKPGSNSFQTKIDKSFFEAFNYSNPHDCNIDVVFDFRKETHLMDIRVKYNGITNINCDRCLGSMEVNIDGDFNSVIQFSHVEDEVIKDGIIYLPYESHQFNVAPVIYEHYLLNFPKRNIHQKNDCYTKQINLIEEYSVNKKSNTTDPRWDILKDLKNKKT